MVFASSVFQQDLAKQWVSVFAKQLVNLAIGRLGVMAKLPFSMHNRLFSQTLMEPQNAKLASISERTTSQLLVQSHMFGSFCMPLVVFGCMALLRLWPWQ